jgi:hypothetical protein
MKHRPTAPRPTRRRLAFALALIALAGCGGSDVPVATDEDKARQTLDLALTSWQGGKTVEQMKDGDPSIVISDPKWSRGDALKKYEVTGPGKPSGSEREFTVVLWLADAQGKEAREQVVFRVGTNPILTVFRSLF